MATVIQYDKAYRQKVLQELKEQHSVEEVSLKYKVPVAVINNWVSMERAESYLDSLFEGDSHKDNNERAHFLLSKFKTISDFLKENILYGCLIIGTVAVIFICYLFRGYPGFLPGSDPIKEVVPKVDSILTKGSEIEMDLEQQQETTSNIAKVVDDILNDQKRQTIQIETVVRKTVNCLDKCQKHKPDCQCSTEN